MAELLKDRLNKEVLEEFATSIKRVYEPFPIQDFINFAMDDEWDNLELMGRGKKITTSLAKCFPQDYKTSLSIIDKVIEHFEGENLVVWSFPDFVEIYGQDEQNWDLSMTALAKYTEYASSEFAVRPFIINNEERMMAQMYEWSKHENEHIRRLSSEGCRPQLPWATSLPKFKKDPTPILPILEQLKTDSSLYVRKSVANNLNDISKTHPDLVANLAKKWYGKNEYTDWIVKHACRTLL
ncbi:MAG: DNA alkylation repair protein, partial [Defluviitaleaceae bacterium]|nr:DNA alkylation repair protein [Defluviitaleaceae bacterium]